MTQNSSSSINPKVRFWNRVQLLLILAVFAAPIIGAFIYQPDKFNNYGDIYNPVRPVSNLLMTGKEGQVEMDSFRRQWLFLVIADGECGKACEENILKMRQLRFMQNNDMTRIRTVFLHTGLPPVIAKDLAEKYQPIESYRVEGDEFERWTSVLRLENAPEAALKDRFYIIDPAGNLMMSYPANADPNIMKKDIKRLLKASQIG